MMDNLNQDPNSGVSQHNNQHQLSFLTTLPCLTLTNIIVQTLNNNNNNNCTNWLQCQLKQMNYIHNTNYRKCNNSSNRFKIIPTTIVSTKSSRTSITFTTDPTTKFSSSNSSSTPNPNLYASTITKPTCHYAVFPRSPSSHQWSNCII